MDKPVHVSEFVARVRAAVRRHQREVEAATDGRVLRTGALIIDCDAETVTKHGEPVRLTRTEYRLLAALATHIGRVAPHRYLLSTVWGEEYVGDSHYLRVYMSYLRNKLEDNPAQPRYVLNEWGTGYRLAALAPAVEDMAPAEVRTATVA
jgi:two-component system KDP operon response regulator KdpE